MKTVTFTEFRKNASSLISDVEDGETIQLVRHGKPVAEIIPVQQDQASIPSWRRPSLRLSMKGASLSQAILQERESS